MRAPVAMISGWHDIFLPAQLDDYAALRAAGAHPRLTVGPWTHGSPGLFVAALRDGLDWLDEHLAGAAAGPRTAPVRVHVGGAGGGWRDLPDWPPPAASTPAGTCTPGAARAGARRRRPRRTGSGTTRPTPPRRWAARCWSPSGPGRWTTGASRPGRTC